MLTKGIKRAIAILIPLVFWLLVWELLSLVANADFILPSPLHTLSVLLSLFGKSSFYKAVFASLLRVLLGFAIGALMGAALALAAHASSLLSTLIAPIMTVIKATPVASFIMVLWCFIGSSPVPTVIGALMVAPLIYHSLIKALQVKNTELDEVCRVYKIQGIRKFRFLYFPTILEFLIPAAVSAMGLCWKASIAAEIIAYTKNSIGREIYLSKAFLEGATLFAYTTVVILLSLVFEKLMHYIGEKVKERCHL